MTLEEKNLLRALFSMYEQYCKSSTGHEGHLSMQAGEEAEKILMEYNLFTDGKLDELKLPAIYEQGNN